jgi:hypothetical protein
MRAKARLRLVAPTHKTGQCPDANQLGARLDYYTTVLPIYPIHTRA